MKIDHRTLWEEARQLNITDSSYPGQMFARLVQRNRLIKNIEKLRKKRKEKYRNSLLVE